MKRIFIIALGIIIFSGSASAQSLLDKLGKTVQKKVTEKVTDAVRKEVRKAVSGKGHSDSQKPQTSEQDAAARPVSAAVAQKPAVKDEGQNIMRQDGLDYIDEYGINHGGGILIGDVLWAPVNWKRKSGSFVWI